MGGIHRKNKARLADAVDQFTNITTEDRLEQIICRCQRWPQPKIDGVSELVNEIDLGKLAKNLLEKMKNAETANPEEEDR